MRVTVLKEETVIPRKEVVSSGPEGSVAVMIATGYGTRRMRRRTWSDIDVGSGGGCGTLPAWDGVLVFPVQSFSFKGAVALLVYRR